MAAANTPTVIPRRAALSRMVRAVTSPYYRYRHAKVLHSLRVGLAMLVSILATTGIDIPHGIWSSVTLLVVIGGLQHHGNIRKKAAERAAGTLLGASIGLLLIVQQNFIGSLPLTYVLEAIIASICAWFAIGSSGYIGLLTAITMCIVAGHGDNLIDVGLWRTLNVLIGIVIALAFSFAFPLHATYSWRYGLAANLRECAGIYARLLDGETITEEEQVQRFLRINKRLVQLRSLMPSVAKEIDVPQTRLEEIQRLHRSVLSSLELLATGPLMNAAAAARAAPMQRIAAPRCALCARSCCPPRAGCVSAVRRASAFRPRRRSRRGMATWPPRCRPTGKDRTGSVSGSRSRWTGCARYCWRPSRTGTSSGTSGRRVVGSSRTERLGR
ncbi:FUSC family protein [Paraburkholderia sp. JPY419]|uniref:FUSC family protein n=1 Tax=Paraburkholderia sp. JPY419 TaxID=667660 RepID=UPI003D1BE97A